MVDRVVLDVQLADAQLARQAIGFHQRREARVEAGLRRFDRQQLEIAPQRRRARFDQLPAEHLLDRRVVVGDLERAQAFRAHPQRLRRIGGATEVTRQSRNELHTVLPWAEARASGITFDDWCTASALTVTGDPAASHVDCSSRPTREVAPRQHGHRRTRARQAGAEHVGIVDRERRGEMRHQRRPRRLMPAILHRLAQPIVLAVLQRVHQRQHPLQVENRILARHRGRQRRACLRRGQADKRRRHDQPQILGPSPLQDLHVGAVDHDRRQAAEERRRGVVGVSFERRRHREQRCFPGPVPSPARTRASPRRLPPRCCPGRPPSECRFRPRRTRSGTDARCAARARQTPAPPRSRRSPADGCSRRPASRRRRHGRRRSARAGTAGPRRPACRSRRRDWRQNRERLFRMPRIKKGPPTISLVGGPGDLRLRSGITASTRSHEPCRSTYTYRRTRTNGSRRPRRRR